MKLPHLSKTQFLILVLIVGIVINTWIHFTSPAYLYYREKVAEIKDDNSLFRRRVYTDLMPLIFMKTNSFCSSSVVVSNGVVSSSFNSSYSESRYAVIDASFFILGGEMGFFYNGWQFFIGDLFYGDQIVYIDPTMAKTRTMDFFFKRNIRNQAKGPDKNINEGEKKFLPSSFK